jgi:hypothetical protein
MRSGASGGPSREEVPVMALWPVLADLDPGDAGWGDVLFVSIWAGFSLLLAAYFCYRSFLAR